MAEPKNPELPVVATAAEPSLSLADFCIRLSESVSRPELIGAFAHVEQKDGKIKDTALNFRARFDAFINKPV
jgi:hypothetical protein